ncbi:MAG TPA: NAD(P)/FAD-dependent oxidoreductase [Terriglobales bacterium]|nr:NAD(P)/FAD-dependent oxidoreductase [Terriglobales bacterium]
MKNEMYETDVCIIGGGPAGLAAALALRRTGLDVIVADAAHPPIDKACGEGIMPDGLAALSELGVGLDRQQGAPFTGIRLINGAQTVEAPFQRGAGLGIRRIALHQQLVDTAAHAGVRLLWKHRFKGLAPGQVLLDGQVVRCRWIVGADGQQSRTRYHAGLEPDRPGRVRFGMRQHFRIAPWSDFVEVHWSDCGEMYVTPVGQDEVCVAFLSSGRNLRFDHALPHFPALQLRLKKAIVEEPARGAVTSSRRLGRVQRRDVALIGEAAGSVDSITGEGLAISFRQAMALADAVRAGDLARYESAHRRIMRLPRAMAALMLSMDGRPRFRTRFFRAFQAQPEIFARMLAVHTGSLSPAEFGVGNGLSLGWHLLADRA